jgi:hypothetical protein
VRQNPNVSRLNNFVRQQSTTHPAAPTQAAEPQTLAAVAAGVASAASLLPARRAVPVDPEVSLRHE